MYICKTSQTVDSADCDVWLGSCNASWTLFAHRWSAWSAATLVLGAWEVPGENRGASFASGGAAAILQLRSSLYYL